MEEANQYGIEEKEEERDLDKWDDAQTVTLLKVFETFKPQFDAPYSKKMKIWIKVVSIRLVNELF